MTVPPPQPSPRGGGGAVSPSRGLAGIVCAYRREVLLLAIFSMVVNVLLLIPPLYLLQVFDQVLVHRSEMTLLAAALVALGLFAVLALCDWARARVLAHAAMRLEGELGAHSFQASLRAQLAAAGATAARAASDLRQVRQFLNGPALLAVFDLPWTPVYVAASFMLHPLLGFAAIAFVLVQGALAWLVHRSTLTATSEASGAASEPGAFLHGRLRQAETIEALGMLPALRRSWCEQNELALKGSARAQAISARLQAWSRFIRFAQQTLALAAGALLVIDGQLTPGAMIAASLLIHRALAPIDQAVSVWQPLLNARDALHRLMRLLEDHPERAPGGFTEALQGAVVLKDVVARVQGRDAPLLRKVSLEVEPGTLVAVLGPSGAGKSTLARVLMGAWPEVEGEVLLDGRPVTEWNRDALGPQLGYLPQDAELFEGSVAENIARLQEVDPAAVIAAAQAAGLHETILRLPQGYDTPVGEAGGLLSTGQRQRIALARALYGEPMLLVLDEPDANLDEAGIAALRRGLVRLRARGRTVIVITHLRGPLVGLAEQVVQLHEGRVKVQGPAEAVLAILRAAQPDSPLKPPATPQPA
jgi:ATP-binding cassette, subfamily C, bacterial exporter for protease/lipase